MSGVDVPLNPISELHQDFDHIDYLNVQESNNQKPKPNGCIMGTSLSCVGMIWAFLSVVSMITTLIGFFMPFWISGQISLPGKPNYTASTHFGLWRRCNYLILNGDDSLDIEDACGRYAAFTDIPTVWWQIATVLVGVGCALSVFIAFLGLLMCCVSKVFGSTLAKTTAVLQFMAGELFHLYAKCLFPLLQYCNTIRGKISQLPSCPWQPGQKYLVA